MFRESDLGFLAFGSGFFLGADSDPGQIHPDPTKTPRSTTLLESAPVVADDLGPNARIRLTTFRTHFSRDKLKARK